MITHSYQHTSTNIYAIRCNIHGEHVLHAPPFSVVVAVP